MLSISLKITLNILKYDFLYDILGIKQNIIWGLKISNTFLITKAIQLEMVFFARNMFLVTGTFLQKWKGPCATPL